MRSHSRLGSAAWTEHDEERLLICAARPHCATPASGGASARGALHAVGCSTPHVPRSPAHSLRPLFSLDSFCAARCAALGRLMPRIERSLRRMKPRLQCSPLSALSLNCVARASTPFRRLSVLSVRRGRRRNVAVATRLLGVDARAHLFCRKGGEEDVMVGKVVNVRCEKCDVYVGRGSKWGNRFVIGRDGSRDEVIEKYRVWLWGRKDLLKDLGELKNKRLGCYCAPQPCHGDVLLRAVKWFSG